MSASGDDESLTKRRRQLAVLAVLALGERPVRRDLLVEMFWGDEDEERARHSLSNALSSLRGLLGAAAITARQADIALSHEAGLGVDAVEFTAACEAQDHDRAVALYGGLFLQGVVVPNSPRFDIWVARERTRLERLFLQSCEAQCAVLSRAGNWTDCAVVAARWLDALPPSRVAATTLLKSLAAPGTMEAVHSALAEYDRLARRLEREYESPPDPRVAALAASLREKLVLAPPGTTGATTAATVATGATTAHREPTVASGWFRERRAWQAWTAAAAVLTLAAGAGYRAMAAGDPLATGRIRPLVAVTNVTNVRADTSIAWLEEGLKQMIAADLSRADAIDVVPPSRVHDVLVRAGYPPGTGLSTDQSTDLARRVNATWAITVDLSHGGGGFVLGVNVLNVADGKLLRMYSVTGTDIMPLADAAAARILDVVNASSGAPHFAEIETSSPAAYRHFVRGMQATAAGQFPENERELDAALALDPGFVSAITARRDVAIAHEDIAVAARMDSAFARAADRASNWDRMMDEASRAAHNGEVARAEALSRNLTRRYPRDPRGYVLLASVLLQHGKWGAADTVLNAELALDSLAVEAGSGPCAPCLAYHGLVDSRIESGDFEGAERAARRWIALQPELPDAWVTLANALAVSGRPDAAIAMGQHGATLTSDPYPKISVGRWLIMSRRYDAADAYAAKLRSSNDPQLRDGADDISAMVARERGQLRASNRYVDHFFEQPRAYDAMHLLHADNLARLGEFAAARREFELVAQHGPTDGSPALAGDAARAFAWPRALEADALAPAGDTLLLRALADSLELVGPRSYYGRDWKLFHHVRGLIAERGNRYAEAEREFAAARWGYGGWTRTVAELAHVQSAQGRPRDALATLRHAYVTTPDAMGRYMPRSELDLRMSAAFHAAGMADSARIYAGYVRRAWSHADPEVKRLLAGLPAS
jgi:DNA-binding SARP family transcriptional activator/TolB-like protein